MTKRDKPTRQTIKEANANYAQRQAPLNLAFKSPLAMLNITLQDCNQQRAELGVSDEVFERDKVTFNEAIEAVLTRHGFPDTNEKVDFICKTAFAYVGGAMTTPNVPQNYWPLVACHAALVTLGSEQQQKGFIVDAAMANLALFAQGMMNIAWKPERMRQYELITTNLHSLADVQQETNRVLNEVNNILTPLAVKGEKFKPGKPKGAVSPLTLSVKKYLKKHAESTADEVWTALKAKPPKGHYFQDNPQGRYVEYDEPGKNTSYDRFQNIVSEQRPKP